MAIIHQSSPPMPMGSSGENSNSTKKTHGTTLSDSKPTNTTPVKADEIQQSGKAPGDQVIPLWE